jgi:predicted phage terminase large subunit-like protein
MPKGRIVIVATRWVEDDLTGYVRELEKSDPSQKKWTEISLPAISDDGKALWPEKFPLETLMATKHQIGSHHFNALYQQNPTPRDGTIFKREWWKFYRQAPQMNQIVTAWDFAVKDGENNDYSVGIVMGRCGVDKYVLDVVRAKMGFVESQRAVIALAKKWPQAYKKIIEDKANGSPILETLKRVVPGIVAITPVTGKTLRADAVSPDVEAGNVYLPESAPWLSDFLHELSSFPYGKHDDQVDAFCYALSELQKAGIVFAPVSGHGSGVVFSGNPN